MPYVSFNSELLYFITW